MKKDIIYTKHAEDMLVERGFSKILIEDVVLSPDERRRRKSLTCYPRDRWEIFDSRRYWVRKTLYNCNDVF